MVRRLIGVVRGRLAGRVLFFLAATALQVTLTVIILPFSTKVLTATDFGYFALMMSVAAFVNAVSDGGGALALHAHYGVTEPEERRRMIATFLLVALFLSVSLAIVFIVVWPLVLPFVVGADAEEFSFRIALLTALYIPLRSLSTVATAILSVGGRANAIAGQVASQAIGTFSTTLVCLFGLGWGTAALFAGAVVGQIASLAIAGLAMGRQPWVRPSRKWFAVVRGHAPTSAFSGLSDGVRAVGENSVIASSLSVASLGYYSHARLYYGMLLTATNAVTHNIWSTSLAEARRDGGGFERTLAVWTIVHIGVALFGVGAVCFGREVIAVLTNDRLTQAAELVPWLASLLLISLSGRAQNAIVYAHGAGPVASRFRAILTLVSLAILPLVMAQRSGLGLGLPGLIAVLLLEALLFRLYLRKKAEELRPRFAFSDQWAVIGTLAIWSLWTANWLFEPSLFARGAVFVVIVLAVVALEWRRLAAVIKSL